jgi:protein gp37
MMGKDSKVAWTDHTFNGWWGCHKVSPGCKNCYAATFSKRTGQDIWGADKPRRFFGAKHWAEPLKWDRDAGLSVPYTKARVFCASMSDVFETHDNLDIQVQLRDARIQLGNLIRDTQNLTWMLLTKRPENVFRYFNLMFDGCDSIPDNVWIGTTAENQAMYDKRSRVLFEIRQYVSNTFLSIEPQLEPITMNGYIPDWVIVGGESGPGCRPFNPDWARSLRDQCKQEGAAYFMKQLGGVHNHHAELTDLPEDLRIREYPSP